MIAALWSVSLFTWHTPFDIPEMIQLHLDWIKKLWVPLICSLLEYAYCTPYTCTCSSHLFTTGICILYPIYMYMFLSFVHYWNMHIVPHIYVHVPLICSLLEYACCNPYTCTCSSHLFTPGICMLYSICMYLF